MFEDVDLERVMSAESMNVVYYVINLPSTFRSSKKIIPQNYVVRIHL